MSARDHLQIKIVITRRMKRKHFFLSVVLLFSHYFLLCICFVVHFNSLFSFINFILVSSFGSVNFSSLQLPTHIVLTCYPSHNKFFFSHSSIKGMGRQDYRLKARKLTWKNFLSFWFDYNGRFSFQGPVGRDLMSWDSWVENCVSHSSGKCLNLIDFLHRKILASHKKEKVHIQQIFERIRSSYIICITMVDISIQHLMKTLSLFFVSQRWETST